MPLDLNPSCCPMVPPTSPLRNSIGYYYVVAALAAIAFVLLASNFIAFACCSPSHLLQTLRRFLRSRTVSKNKPDDDPITHLIPLHKYQKEQEGPDAECSVCLSVFVDGEDVRQMPGCKHLFHAPCIDMWLYSHSDCPLCRANVLPPPPCRPTAGGGSDSRQQRPLESSLAHVVVALL